MAADGGSNVERLRFLADSLARFLCPHLREWQRVRLSIEPHPARWLLEHALLEGLAHCGVAAYSDGDTLPTLSVAIAEVGVYYERLSGGMVRRTVRWHVLLTKSAPGEPLVALPAWQTRLQDTLPMAAIPRVQEPAYGFAAAELPPERSVWREFVEPALAVAAAGVIVVLLFALRTR
jgi:hypothetical protein